MPSSPDSVFAVVVTRVYMCSNEEHGQEIVDQWNKEDGTVAEMFEVDVKYVRSPDVERDTEVLSDGDVPWFDTSGRSKEVEQD